MDQKNAFNTARTLVENSGLRIVEENPQKPWGGYFVIDEEQTPEFINRFFPGESSTQFGTTEKLSPKILIVAPGKRLSWQYHDRRAEIWRCIYGEVGVVTSMDDEEKDINTLVKGELILLKRAERHRLVGLNDWGIVAEIWIHTDPENPSSEEDIVRLQDDFER